LVGNVLGIGALVVGFTCSAVAYLWSYFLYKGTSAEVYVLLITFAAFAVGK
jgi:hypothetical protein